MLNQTSQALYMFSMVFLFTISVELKTSPIPSHPIPSHHLLYHTMEISSKLPLESPLINYPSWLTWLASVLSHHSVFKDGDAPRQKALSDPLKASSPMGWGYMITVLWPMVQAAQVPKSLFLFSKNSQSTTGTQAEHGLSLGILLPLPQLTWADTWWRWAEK